MIHHAMLLIQKNTAYVNAGQTSVMTGDQSLFALAKEVQWLKLDLLCERNSLS